MKEYFWTNDERIASCLSTLAMIAKAWIKLYIEILTDPKMGQLPNHLWRRAVELFLLAGREGNDGALPPVKEMVWILRVSQDKLLEDLHGLAKVGVVHGAEPGTWVVTNFAKRQEALTSTQRSYFYRKRNNDATNRCKMGTENATVPAESASTSTSVSFSGSESLERERVQGEGEPRPPPEALPESAPPAGQPQLPASLPESAPPAGQPQLPASLPDGQTRPDVFRAYEQNIGLITPMIADALRDAEASDSPEWVCAAIDEAVKNNVRTWKYIETILRRWRVEGFQSDNRLEKTSRHSRPGGGISAEQALAWMRADRKAEDQ